MSGIKLGTLWLVVTPQVGQQHEDVKKKWEYYHIIIFPERT